MFCRKKKPNIFCCMHNSLFWAFQAICGPNIFINLNLTVTKTGKLAFQKTKLSNTSLDEEACIRFPRVFLKVCYCEIPSLFCIDGPQITAWPPKTSRKVLPPNRAGKRAYFQSCLAGFYYCKPLPRHTAYRLPFPSPTRERKRITPRHLLDNCANRLCKAKRQR